MVKSKQNFTECKYDRIILYGPKTKTITKHLNFRISGQNINIVKQTKYLGIYLDGTTWIESTWMELST